jgi:hypothetical protein
VYNFDELLDEFGEFAYQPPEPEKTGAPLRDVPLEDMAAKYLKPAPEPEPVELPKASAPIAAAAPRQQQNAGDDAGGGYDWQRMLASLFSGRDGVNDLDRRRQGEQANQIARAKSAEDSRYLASKERREQELHEAILPQKQAQAEDLSSKTKAREMQIAGSEVSKATVANVAAGLRMQAARIKSSGGDQAQAALLEKQAGDMERNTDRLSGYAAVRLLDRFGKFGEGIAHDALKQVDQDIASGRLGEMIRHNKVTEGQGAQRIANSAEQHEDKEIKIRDQAQEKLNLEINDLETALGQMTDLAKLKEGVNTGFIMNALAKVGEKFDMTSEQRNNLNALVARIFNKETKKLAGSAVSEAEWARIAPQIPQPSDDDNVFMSKLRRAMEETRAILAKRKQDYQLNANGKATDKSITGQRAAAEGAAAVGNAAPAPAADPKAQMAEKARRALASPAASEKAKAGARKWLQENGYGAN